MNNGIEGTLTCSRTYPAWPLAALKDKVASELVPYLLGLCKCLATQECIRWHQMPVLRCLDLCIFYLCCLFWVETLETRVYHQKAFFQWLLRLTSDLILCVWNKVQITCSSRSLASLNLSAFLLSLFPRKRTLGWRQCCQLTWSWLCQRVRRPIPYWAVPEQSAWAQQNWNSY